MIRLEPDLWEWVQAQGGGAWARQVFAAAREKGKLSANDLAPVAGES